MKKSNDERGADKKKVIFLLKTYEQKVTTTS